MMPKKSFAETAMELGGKTFEEIKSMGKVDKADDQVEELFSLKYQTVNSPAHRAVWDHDFPSKEFFNFNPDEDEFPKVKKKCLQVIRKHKKEDTIYNSSTGKLSDQLISDLASAGYFGLLVDLPKKPAMKLTEFVSFLSQVATLEPNVAGLASVHGCIGAVDPVRTFGTEEQKKKFLPLLASGKKLSAFALTEPNAGSDLTALKTRAVLNGDHYIVNGEKLFITNAICGRLISLVCMIDGEPQVLIVDLPNKQTKNFKIKKYGLYALTRLNNNGLIFKDFKVPKENLLSVDKGNGLTVAYHGLNLGRISLCANASGCMKVMLADMLPWARFRRTYGGAIISRELVQMRVAKLAGYILSADAMSHWCASLLDQGYRGELECIIAKIFGSECQKEAAIDLCMKTHGGRSFLHGHPLGDNLHDLLAPCIYEGEGDMLNLAFFKSLVKDHGVKYFEPIGWAMKNAGIDGMPNALQFMKNIKVFMPYMKWMLDEYTCKFNVNLDGVCYSLADHASFATNNLRKSASQISKIMRKYQLKLADRQCRMSLISSKIQNLIIMLATIGFASERGSDIDIEIADVSCEFLKNKVIGSHPTDHQLRKAVELGKKIAENKFIFGDDINGSEILMPYEQ